MFDSPYISFLLYLCMRVYVCAYAYVYVHVCVCARV